VKREKRITTGVPGKNPSSPETPLQGKKKKDPIALIHIQETRPSKKEKDAAVQQGEKKKKKTKSCFSSECFLHKEQSTLGAPPGKGSLRESTPTKAP